ncbi:MAG: hypothetical protein WD097_06215 [Balneolales bacterium]
MIADSSGYNVEIVNSGVSGETSAGGLRRIDWVLQREFDIFVLELGGNAYTQQFRQIFHDLAASNDVTCLGFILEGVAGNPELNQSNGIHPTSDGHRIVASRVWKELEPLLQKY